MVGPEVRVQSVGGRSYQRFGFITLPGKVEVGSKQALQPCLRETGRELIAWESGQCAAQDGRPLRKILPPPVKVSDELGCGDGERMRDTVHLLRSGEKLVSPRFSSGRIRTFSQILKEGIEASERFGVSGPQGAFEASLGPAQQLFGRGPITLLIVSSGKQLRSAQSLLVLWTQQALKERELVLKKRLGRGW